jgi:hypothetical protein
MPKGKAVERPQLLNGVRAAQAQGKIIPAGLASWKAK